MALLVLLLIFVPAFRAFVFGMFSRCLWLWFALMAAGVGLRLWDML